MANEGAKDGVKAALEIALNDPERIHRAKQAKLPLDPVGAQTYQDEPEPEPRKPGRPPGAINRRTEAVARFILANYSHPLQGLAEFYSRPVDELAAILECSKLEAARLQIAAMGTTAEYVAQKQPRAVEIDAGAGTVAFVMATEEDIAALAAAAGDDDRPWLDATDVTPPPAQDADKSEG